MLIFSIEIPTHFFKVASKNNLKHLEIFTYPDLPPKLRAASLGDPLMEMFFIC